MIFITAKFRILPQDADRWPEIVGEWVWDTNVGDWRVALLTWVV